MAITGITPQLRTTDLEATIAFYVDKLGFALEFRFSDFYAGVKVGNQLVHLKLVDEPDPSIPVVQRDGHLHLYLSSDDIESDEKRLKANGVVFRHELAEVRWQMREFYIQDDQGHVLCYGQPTA